MGALPAAAACGGGSGNLRGRHWKLWQHVSRNDGVSNSAGDGVGDGVGRRRRGALARTAAWVMVWETAWVMAWVGVVMGKGHVISVSKVIMVARDGMGRRQRGKGRRWQR